MSAAEPPPARQPASPAPAVTAERRRTDRRQGDRRQGGRRREDTLPQPAPGDPWLSLWSEPVEPQAGEGGARPGSARGRVLRTYALARAALAVGLVAVPFLAGAATGQGMAWGLVGVSLVYALLVLAWAVQLIRGRVAFAPGQDGPQSLRVPDWLWTIGLDLIAFAALRQLDRSELLNYGALLVLPALMAGALTAARPALLTALGVSAMLVVTGWPRGGVHSWPEALLTLAQSALAGVGVVLIALLASELSQRLAREEQTARESLHLARRQTALSRLVIDEMPEGVIVLDRAGVIQALNPAARALLAPWALRAQPPLPLDAEPALAPLAEALARAYELGRWPEADSEQRWQIEGGAPVAVQVRVRFTRLAERRGRADGAVEDFCVMFLEELAQLRERQSQDRLAAMGRMSAGIAHEIRNPLAAIANAATLLREDWLDDRPAPQQPPRTAPQLLGIVDANVVRLKRIVDDVLEVAPSRAQPSPTLDAAAHLRADLAEWRASAGSPWSGVALQAEIPPGPVWVAFDAEHLRRVLVNLLDNAARHASGGPGSVRLAMQPGPHAPQLTVASDGPPLPPEVERHLFEPFYSTRSRGSGLGLYICRALCERHGAKIGYLAEPAPRVNAFVVQMRPRPQPPIA